MTIRISLDNSVRKSTVCSWAVNEFVGVLTKKGYRVADGAGVPVGKAKDLADKLIEVGRRDDPGPTVLGDQLCVAVGFSGEELSVLTGKSPKPPESFSLIHLEAAHSPIIGVIGADERGVAYGILELADVAMYSQDPLADLIGLDPGEWAPKLRTRSVSRAFSSEVQDLEWFRSKQFWDEYLSCLASNRINRFQLALGMQYNYSHDLDVQDTYLTFPYPFLVDVPEYTVRVSGLEEKDRQINIESLRYASSAAARRGIDFQLGIWNHAYDFLDSPRQRYQFKGLNSANHADYSKLALKKVLDQCPDISGITVRAHYEGGVHEPSHEFWKTVFSAAKEIDRNIHIDMHAKGADNRILEAARESGKSIEVSGKIWAEHQGLPYHQASVREMEKALPLRDDFTGVTRSVRRFTRYSYADFLQEDRDHSFVFRLWPGTQRILLWGDPYQVANMTQSTVELGADGIEICEPLYFFGRKTSGTYGQPRLYRDLDLEPEGGLWKKYDYTYRLWGRLMYDPEDIHHSVNRYMNYLFGRDGDRIGKSLAIASRILPAVTTIHAPSASNNMYWPEMYLDFPLANQSKSNHYAFDTPEPHTFTAVSPLDPVHFSSIDDFADELVQGKRSYRTTPWEVATAIKKFANFSLKELQNIEGSGDKYRRVVADIRAQALLGLFFAHKIQSGIAYALHIRTGKRADLEEAVASYAQAVDAYETLVQLTSEIYLPDLGFGDRLSERGHWADRLNAIKRDFLAMQREESDYHSTPASPNQEQLISLERPDAPPVTLEVPGHVARADSIPVRAHISGAEVSEVVLHYRHANNGEEWNTKVMSQADNGHYSDEIPVNYVDSPYRIQLYISLYSNSVQAWSYPGVGEDLLEQPYVVVKVDQ